jgi:hypothetical protein
MTEDEMTCQQLVIRYLIGFGGVPSASDVERKPTETSTGNENANAKPPFVRNRSEVKREVLQDCLAADIPLRGSLLAPVSVELAIAISDAVATS